MDLKHSRMLAASLVLLPVVDDLNQDATKETSDPLKINKHGT